MRNPNKKDWSKILPEDPLGADALWDLSAGFGESSTTDVQQGWEQFEQRLAAQPVASPSKQIRRFNWKRTLTAAAAAISLLFLINYFSSSSTFTQYANVEASSKTLLLDDDTEVVLFKGSTLSVRMEENARLVELVGEATFDVASNVNRPFSLTTPELDLVVIGTEFNVRSGENATVTVEEGHVRVRGRNEVDWTDLFAGDNVTIRELLVVEKVELAPTQGTPLRFNAELMSKVVKSVEAAHNIELLIPTKLANCSITADFSQNTVSEIASSLAVLFDAEMRIDGQTVELKGGRCQ